MRVPLRSPALIESWFDLLPPPQQAGARALDLVVMGAVPTLARAIKWGQLVYLADGAHTLALAPHKTHLHLQLFAGAALADRFPQLLGSGRALRHLRWRHGDPIDEDVVAAVTRAAVGVVRRPHRPLAARPGGHAARDVPDGDGRN